MKLDSAKWIEKKKTLFGECYENLFCRYVKSTDIVLDIACGYGEFSNYIEAGQKIAIDINPDAKKFLKDDVEFHLSSASAMNEIHSLSVDGCFSSNFFEHLADKETMDGVLYEAFRVLKPNGRYVGNTAKHHNL